MPYIIITQYTNPLNSSSFLLITQVELLISNLPRLDDGNSHTYECVFGDFAVTTAMVEFMADRTNITCGTPDADSIQSPVDGE